MSVWRAPKVLIIVLKRFANTWAPGAHVKNDSLVNFPLRGLDIKPHLRDSPHSEDAVYDCFAVSNHSGSLSGGHYTAYARSPLSAAWYSFNDSHVTPVGNLDLLHSDPDSYEEAVEKLLQTQSAYVLMYRKRNSIDKNALRHLQPSDEEIARLTAEAEEDAAATYDASPSHSIGSAQPLSPTSTIDTASTRSTDTEPRSPEIAERSVSAPAASVLRESVLAQDGLRRRRDDAEVHEEVPQELEDDTEGENKGHED